MHASLSLGPLVSLMAGVLILIAPRLLNCRNLSDRCRIAVR
jgi:hypothetical protein